jgi:chromate transporter
MIFLKLFITFFEIGLVSFGGGLGMVALIREKVLMNNWLTEEQFMNIIAVSESTPGPIAVNVATFVGSTQAGILGSFMATFGVILPSFIIILIIAALLKNFMKYKGVAAFLMGIRPVVVALVFGTVITMGLSTLFKMKVIGDEPAADIRAVIIFTVLVIIHLVYKKLKKVAPSPIIMIMVSAVLGIIAYSS